MAGGYKWQGELFQPLENKGVGFVYGEGIEAGEVDFDGGSRAVARSFADDRQWHAFCFGC